MTLPTKPGLSPWCDFQPMAYDTVHLMLSNLEDTVSRTGDDAYLISAITSRLRGSIKRGSEVETFLCLWALAGKI